jgi:hypothetical protein
MKKIIKIFVLATILVSTSGYGDMMLGQGAKPCDTWAKDRKEGSLITYTNQAWVLGYLSAVNSYGYEKDILESSENDELFDWIDNYCEQYPLKDIDDASNALIKVLINS